MTAYNQEKYIAQAIESVLSQQVNFPVTLLISDDCSTDSTLSIAMRYKHSHPDKVRVLTSSSNQGLARNFCSTWIQCDSKYIAILEADDFWCSPRKLQTQVSFLESHPRFSMCFALTNLLDENGSNRHDQWPYHKLTKQTFTATDIIRHNLIANCSVMYRANVLDSLLASFYPWLLSLSYLDIALHILHAIHGPIGYVPDIMATYRLHNGSSFEYLPYEERLAQSAIVYTALSENLPDPYCYEAQQTLVLMKQGLAFLNASNYRVAYAHLSDSFELLNSLPFKYKLSGPSLIASEISHRLKAR
jgi:glycosyltransferase involved in cell wall biosynthesis